MKVEIDKFGKSHWGLLLYIETRCVDYKGKLDFSQMRINGERHPGLDVNRIREVSEHPKRWRETGESR